MSLKEKLAKVMQECSHISRDAYNPEVGYPYVTAAKLNDVVNRALTANGVVTAARSSLIDIRTINDRVLATVEVEIALYDTESEESLTIRGVGSGIDEGDKSVAKGQTMAVKYAWKNSLLIADSSDEPDAVDGKIVSKVSNVSKPQAVKTAATGKPTVQNKIVAPF